VIGWRGVVLSRVFAREFPAVIRARGAAYFQRRAVKIDLASSHEVHATVRGSDAYAVLLSARRTSLGVFCTCPYFDSAGRCKHVWATLLAAEARGEFVLPRAVTKIEDLSERDRDDASHETEPEEDDDDHDASDDELDDAPVAASASREPLTRARWSPPPPVRARRDRRQPVDWRALVAQASVNAPAPIHGAAPSTHLEIRYIVDVPASRVAGDLMLRIAAFERLRDGTLALAKPGRLRQSSLGHLADDRDRQVLCLLAGAGALRTPSAYSYSSYFSSADADPFVPDVATVPSTLHAFVLRTLASTGRCSIRIHESGEGELPLRWQEEGYALALRVDRDPPAKTTAVAGRLVLGQQSHALDTAPLLLVSGIAVLTDHAAPFDHGGAFGWVLLFRQHGTLTVPRHQEGELLEKLFSLRRVPRLELPDSLRFEESRPKPTPALRIALEAPSPWQGKRLMGSLSFLYDGVAVPASRPGDRVLRAAERRLLFRDGDAERAAEAKLVALGFRAPRTVYNRDPDDVGRYEISPRNMPAAVRELVTAGWRVEAQGKVYRQAGSFKLSVTSGIDWFGLDGTCDFDGVSASLPALLAAARKGETTVVLGDGSLGLLPEAWLARYGLLASLGKSRGDRLEFRQSQVGILDALLASQPDVQVDAAFARARDQLGSFAGVHPMDAPPTFRGSLRTYQREGLGWLSFLQRFGLGGCLADDMGLGKTVQVLALLVARKGKTKAPSLVVVPKSIVWNWTREAGRFAPELSVFAHVGKERPRNIDELSHHDLIVTTYGTLRRDAAALASTRFDYVILDEAQAIKNASSESAKAARLLQAEHRLALSGTPVENHLGDLWSLLDFLNPGLLGASGAFASGLGGKRPEPEAVAGLARALRPFILRRTKTEVAKDLPAKHEETVMCEMEPAQRRVYDDLRDHYRASLLGKIEREGLGRTKIQVLEALLRLRQAACHPGLIDQDRAAEPSAKLDLLIERLAEVVAEGHKALVFSQFTSFLALVRARLDARGQAYEYLDGKSRDREARVNRFQVDPACPLFLISLKAGGVGLNLTAADYVFILDPWWNPAAEAQAVDRAHRIGQNRRVFVYRLLCRDTVEEKVAELQNKKRALADAIITGQNSVIQELTREDLERLLS
jgi:superfamily II DNA or RNA helicase